MEANITLNRNDHYNTNKPLMYKGQVVTLSKKKRFCFIISKVVMGKYNYTYTMKIAYSPSPKSQLKSKRIFSKFKIPIAWRTQQ